MIIPLLLALLACERPDPELVQQKRALNAWRDGKEHLQDGEPAKAVEDFEKALEERPGDPVLQAWLAQALAAKGDLDRAIAVLDAVLAEHPGFAEARYNRAAYLARTGEPEAAAADLKRALDDGARPARDVLRDPDFERYLDHPAFNFLPRQALVIAVDPPRGPAFMGGQVDVRLQVLGTGGDVVSLEAAETSGPVRLLRVVENLVQSTEGPGRELVFTFEVLGPGDVSLGPLRISAGPHEAWVAPVAFETVAAKGKQGPKTVPPVVLTTASQVGAAHALPSATWIGGRHLVVKAQPGDRIEIEPDPGVPERVWEMRELGRPLWTLSRWELPSPPERVRVVREGRAVLDGSPVAEESDED